MYMPETPAVPLSLQRVRRISRWMVVACWALLIVLPLALVEYWATASEAVLARAELFGHHPIRRETLSVRERMSQVLERLDTLRFTAFTELFQME